MTIRLHCDSGQHKAIQGRTPVAGEAAARKASVPWPRQRPTGQCHVWFCFVFDSGIFSAGVFLVAMISYDATIPVQQGTVLVAWLNMWAAILFVIESLIDIAWSVFPGLANEHQRATEQALLAPSQMTADAWNLEASLGAHLPPVVPPQKRHLLDIVNWNLWSAIFFFIASVAYLWEAFVDPCMSDLCGAKPSKLSGHLDFFACVIFVICSLMSCMGRWRSTAATPVGEQLVVLRLWRAKGFLGFDWGLWGDIFFLLGSIMTLWVHFDFREGLQAWSYMLWTMDAICYVFEGMRIMLDLNKCRTMLSRKAGTSITTFRSEGARLHSEETGAVSNQ